LRAMCAMLAQGRVDYSLDAAANISHAEFQRTDDHERWHASHLAMFREHLANTNLLGAGAEDQIARIIAA